MVKLSKRVLWSKLKNPIAKMLTRREKLLIRPWQLRRYNNHRKKVLTALPVIDFGPPARRGHVTLKLKKLQKEGERQMKIEEDNFRLLQKMGTIMKKNRLDNFWEVKPPTFLRRVGIYHRTRSPSPLEELASVPIPPNFGTRKSRCLACSPQMEKPKKIPEERIPWEPPKKSFRNERKTSSATVSVKTVEPSSDIGKTTGRKNFTTRHVNQKLPNTVSCLPFVPGKGYVKAVDEASEKQIILDQGPLLVAVNFPIYVDVKVRSVDTEKYIQRGSCSCQALQKNCHNL